MYQWGILLLVVTATVVPGTVAMDAAISAEVSETDVARSSGTPVTEIRTYNRTPAVDGSVRVTATYELASEVDGLCIRVQSEATDVEATGFYESMGYCNYYWNGSAREPTVSFVIPVETRNDTAPGPFVETDDWTFVRAHIPGKFRTTDDDDWSFFQQRPSFEWAIDRRARFAAGNGTAIGSHGLMGPARTANWTGDGELFRIVSPRAGNTSLDRYRSVLAEASRDLRVGDRGNVTVVALPEGIHAGSLSSGATLVPVGEEWPFRLTRETWIHEYVHTRQAVAPGERMGWFVEASASYYELLLSVQQGEMTYGKFRKEASGGRYPDAVLANRSTWQHGSIPYERGPRVFAALDARIRSATNGTRTFADVFYLLNRRSGEVSYSEFKRDVATVAGRSLNTWLDRYFTTNATPPMPDDGGWVEQPPRSRDFDGDGISTNEEKRRGLNPFRVDSDGDGVPDGEQPDTTIRTTTWSTTDSSVTDRPATTTSSTTATSTTAPTTAEPSEAPIPGFGLLPSLAALVVAALRTRQS